MLHWPIDDAEEEIISPRTNDVLCQRGKAAFAHEGNLYFRSIINARMSRYQAAHDRVEKSLIVCDVVQHILNRGGRFLKRNANKDHWTMASPRDAKDKVSYALRRSAIGDNREKFHKGYGSSDDEGSLRNHGSSTSIDSLSSACISQPVSNDFVGFCELKKIVPERTTSVCKTDLLLQSATGSFCYDSIDAKKGAMNNDKISHVDITPFNVLGDDEEEIFLEQVFEDKKFEKSFGDLIDTYNNMSLRELMSDEH
mmetsp:Transcript_1797/g.2473  ORF Transcript_1797/g.2473 Transcript_1797/m.2473 type:complete len:254 (+) Transcript_1797:196-957(+)